ncbi:MAG: lysophospholipid acyltransferase family protein [Armatimonadota bacterium]|nr:lysophospholipid acyltransferase family protein [Armatimonadota bacterium]MDR7439359.1 lysophospholipid acyltransferase family protein [Armatimonadota bacterium]MDR7563198.1 lysophospholipid acyltransferase family protein [Armatimonadota bacterium]MDR7567387.1 lysophospholipid acyltransferase family protein [Armatimonadota bacterium]MDR7602826.1 lysophospholipid acyltransferase family protein [Armatimonadota bacterium]
MNRWVYTVSKALLRAMLGSLFRMRVIGREHEPLTGPLLVVANHWSALDPPVLGCALRRSVHFMAKEELFRIPGLRTWMRAVGTFPVRRGEPDRAAIRTALELIRRGEAVVIFPEGTRNPRGYLLPAEPGAAFLALRAGVPLLPVGIVGTLQAMPKGAWIPRPRRIEVRIGRPFRLDHLPSNREGLEAASDRIMGAIAELLGVDPPVRAREGSAPRGP